MSFKYNAVWISDIHLGTPQCRAQMLLDFLRECETDTLYLVGDVIDILALKRKLYWKQEFWTVIQKILRLSRKGVEVKYICGNHDAMIRQFLDDHGILRLEGVQILDYCKHVTKKGEIALVMHGDQFDGAIRSMPWLYWLGDHAYSCALFLNRMLNCIRSVFGMDYWSLSAFLKNKVKRAVNFINDFEKFVSDEAKKHSVDAVICGHIHTPQIREFDSLMYYNDGDWCESCTALVEDLDGTLRVVDHNHNTIASN